MKIYLVGPINGCTDAEAKPWRDSIASAGFDVLDPMVRDYRGKELEKFREIVEEDKADIRQADILLMYFWRPSVGSAMEVHYGHSLGKPIVVVHPEDVTISPWLRYHATVLFTSFAPALHWCENYDSGMGGKHGCPPFNPGRLMTAFAWLITRWR